MWLLCVLELGLGRPGREVKGGAAVMLCSIVPWVAAETERSLWASAFQGWVLMQLSAAPSLLGWKQSSPAAPRCPVRTWLGIQPFCGLHWPRPLF